MFFLVKKYFALGIGYPKPVLFTDEAISKLHIYTRIQTRAKHIFASSVLMHFIVFCIKATYCKSYSH